MPRGVPARFPWSAPSGGAAREPVRAKAKAPDAIPKFTALCWGLQCFAMVFALPVPGLGLATTTLFAVPCILHSFVNLRAFEKPTLPALLAFLVAGVMLGGLSSGNLSGVYYNFAFWIVNAYASFLLLSHQQGREIALRWWAWAVAILFLLRALEIFARVPVQITDRNGYGFYLSILMAPLYLAVLRKYSKAVANLCLLALLLLLLLNASRSGIVTGLLVGCALYLQGGRSSRFRARRMVGLAASILALALSLYLLERFSPLFRFQFEWLREATESRDEAVLYEGGGGTVKLRSFLAEKSLELFRKEPVTGVGLYRWNEVFDVDGQPDLDRLAVPEIREHNSYLLWLAETGLMGSIPLALIVLFVVAAIRRCIVLFRGARDVALFVGACVSSAVLVELFFLGNVTASGTWSLLLTAPAFASGHLRRRSRL